MSPKRNLFVVPAKIYFSSRRECEFGPLANIASCGDRKILARRLHRTFGFSSDNTRNTIVRSETGKMLFWSLKFLPCKLPLFDEKNLFYMIIIFILLTRENDGGAIFCANPLRSCPFSKLCGSRLTSHINLLLVRSHPLQI